VYIFIHLCAFVVFDISDFHSSGVDHLKLNFIIIHCQFNVVSCMTLIIREDERWTMKAI